MDVFFNRIKIKNNALIALFACVTMSMSVNAQEIVSLDWDQAIHKALTSNLGLASASADLDANFHNIALARANYLPSLNVSGSIYEGKSGIINQISNTAAGSTTNVGASLSQMIYNEKYLANHKIQQYLLKSDSAQFINSQINLITNAGQAYIDVLIAQDLLKIQLENLKITERNLQASKDKFVVGATDRQEVLRWETQLFANKQNVSTQRASLQVSKGVLNQLLNLPIETRIDLKKLSIETDGFIFSSKVILETIEQPDKLIVLRNYLVNLGMKKSPVITSLNAELAAQSRQLKSDKRWAIPTFNLNANASAQYLEIPLNDTGLWNVGVGMSWPIVNGGANVVKVKQSRDQLSSLELDINDTKTSLDQSIRASIVIATGDLMNLRFAEAQLGAAKNNYDLVYETYLEGDTTLLNLLDAQQQHYNAGISERVALYTFFIDLLIIKQSIGFFPVLESPQEVDQIMQDLELLLMQN